MQQDTPLLTTARSAQTNAGMAIHINRSDYIVGRRGLEKDVLPSPTSAAMASRQSLCTWSIEACAEHCDRDTPHKSSSRSKNAEKGHRLRTAPHDKVKYLRQDAFGVVGGVTHEQVTRHLSIRDHHKALRAERQPEDLHRNNKRFQASCQTCISWFSYLSSNSVLMRWAYS